MDRNKDEDRILPMAQPPAVDAPLPYTIELWDLPRRQPERIIGRTASMVLARAIFTAAQTEHLGRKVVLRRGSKIVAESS